MTPPQNTPAPKLPIDPARWLSTLPDDLPICNINILGSHNAAAINTKKRTRWACQRHSITQQLEKGIRLLDIRLKPKCHHNKYDFTTCHGHLGPFGANEFQSLESLLEECTAFLSANPGETIIMTIQIDDWRRTRAKNHPQVLKALQAPLNRLEPINPPYMPTLKECRGRIYLINRINDDPALGVPINIPDNTPGTILEPTAQRQYKVYIQDQYKKLNRRNPIAHKLRLTIEAFEKTPKGALLLNFGSGTKPFGRFVYIMKELSQYLTRQHPHQIGWLLLDYPFGTIQKEPIDLPMQIIASNYH